MPDIRTQSESISRREFDLAGAHHSNARAWSGAASALTSLFIVLLLFIVAVGSGLVLALKLQPRANTWLPEVVTLIQSSDTRPQRIGFLIAALVFAVILAGVVMLRPAAPLWLRNAGEAACLRLDRTFRLANIAKMLTRAGPRWFYLGLFCFCLIAILGIFAWSQHKMATYDGGWLILVKLSDPHIYSVLGKAGEILVGRFAPDSTNAVAYGFGPAALYALGRRLGAAGGYFYAYELARWSNFFVVLVLLSALFRPRFARLGWLPSIILVVTATCVVLPLLFLNDFSAYAPNLAGLRYAPMMFFIIGAPFMPQRATPVSIALFAVLAALGFAYSADVGIISIVAYIAFVGLEEGRIRAKLVRVAVFICAFVVTVLALNFIIRETLGFELLAALKQVTSAEDGGYGGIIVNFSLLDSVIVSLFVATASLLVLESTTRPLDVEERFVVAISLIGFVWYSYYLHRPSPIYWIYGYLAMFNIRYLLRRTSDWKNSARRVGAIVAIATAAIIAQQNFWLIQQAFALEHGINRKVRDEPISKLSGINVPASFAEGLNARIDILDRLHTPDSVVVTGFPYFISTASKISRLPQEVIFSLPSPEKIDAFVADILAKQPSRIFLEPDDSLAWGAGVTRVVVERIENGISAHYKRDEGVRPWRVWNVSSVRDRAGG